MLRKMLNQVGDGPVSMEKNGLLGACLLDAPQSIYSSHKPTRLDPKAVLHEDDSTALSPISIPPPPQSR